MSLTPKEQLNLRIFFSHVRDRLNKMIKETKYPELASIYSRILENISHVPLNLYAGTSLSNTFEGTIFGENVKKFEGGVLRSAIRLPHDHLFDSSGNIRTEGALTLLHEESHVILPESAQHFTARVGLPIYHTDEFFADVLSSHLAKNMGFSREQIGNHLRARRTYFNFPVDRFVLEGRRGVAKEIEAGRFVPRATRRPEPRDPFRAPEEPQNILPRRLGMREKPSIFPGIGRAMPRRFNPRI